jgi:hypothetical protein
MRVLVIVRATGMASIEVNIKVNVTQNVQVESVQDHWLLNVLTVLIEHCYQTQRRLVNVRMDGVDQSESFISVPERNSVRLASLLPTAKNVCQTPT